MIILPENNYGYFFRSPTLLFIALIEALTIKNVRVLPLNHPEYKLKSGLKKGTRKPLNFFAYFKGNPMCLIIHPHCRHTPQTSSLKTCTWTFLNTDS